MKRVYQREELSCFFDSISINTELLSVKALAQKSHFMVGGLPVYPLE